MACAIQEVRLDDQAVPSGFKLYEYDSASDDMAMKIHVHLHYEGANTGTHFPSLSLPYVQVTGFVLTKPHCLQGKVPANVT